VLAGQVSAGTLDVGSNLLLDSIAAVVMGGTALSGGVGGPHRTLLGVLVISILSNGMDVIGVGQYPQSIVKGCVIIAAVALSIDRKRFSAIK
jgi:ribose transport system permease protein/putative xylitol transport system permease protein